MAESFGQPRAVEIHRQLRLTLRRVLEIANFFSDQGKAATA